MSLHVQLTITCDDCGGVYVDTRKKRSKQDIYATVQETVSAAIKIGWREIPRGCRPRTHRCRHCVALRTQERAASNT